MKKIFTLITLLVFTTNYATDRLVDPTLSSGNGTTVFTTITAAINAAVNGDRIIIASNTYNEAALTIGKSLQIMPQTPGTTINFNANITIAGFPGMKLEITGMNLGIYSFNSNIIVNGNTTNRSKVSIINCSSGYLRFDKDFYQVNFIDNQITDGIIFRNGNVIKNITKQISLLDEPQENPNTLERNLIIANQVQFLIGVYNNDYPVVVANNSMRDLSFRRWNANANLKNYIINNEFATDCVLNFSAWQVPYYNIVFSSNKFSAGFYMCQLLGSWSDGNSLYFINYNSPPVDFNYDSWMFRFQFGSNSSWYPANGSGPTKPVSLNTNSMIWFQNGSTTYFGDSAGFLEFSYNGIFGNFSIPASGSPLSLTNIQGQANDIDGGNPNHLFYDIDLTINDRGINGGPYSQLNYNAPNPNNSKAFIFDLDMPTDLFPTQTVDIKAKGYHKN